MKHAYTLLCLLLLTASQAVPGAARGGRGRGGGSFGSLFGGWRSKYGSKSSSSGGGRRVVSGSPVHTAMTVPKLPPPPPPPPPPPQSPKVRPQAASYPRQQLPPGYGYAPSGGQGTYYANAQALPAGAVYYAQPPTSLGMGPGTGFLTGLLAGRLMDGMLFGHRQHVSHVYQQNPQAAADGREIIIINNGQPQGEGVSEQPLNPPPGPAEAGVSTHYPLSVENEEAEQRANKETANATAPPVPAAGGIICFPVMLNETDPQNPGLVRQVERVVCFPAPTADPQSADCQNDPLCLMGASTTSTVPPIVAGDIGGAAEASESLEQSTPSVDADAPPN